MIAYVLRRLLHSAATMLVAVALIFVAMRALPGNPFLAQFGQHPDAEQLEALREQYGWNDPIHWQLGSFFWQLVTRGDLGRSISDPTERISDALRRRIPATIELTLAAVLIAVPVGIGAGVLAAVRHNRWPDYVCMLAALLGVSVPVFFLGICLRGIFTGMPTNARLPTYVFDFEPLTGLYVIDTLIRGRVDLFFAALRHLCLPALALSSIPMAIIARITRASMLDVLSSDFVRTARAKGAARWRIVWRHALPNAAVPIANIAGFQIGLLLSGAVLTETVFDWPGLGTYIVAAVQENDFMVVQAGAIMIAALFVVTNLAVDLCYIWLDPRIRLH